MKLILDSLRKATASLARAMDRAEKNKEDEEVRDAVIQRFEYTYELAWKFLKRQLEKDAPAQASIDSLSYKELIREAFEKKLVEQVEPWFGFREARNITSHTYEENQAKRVYKTAVEFLPAVRKLLSELEKRN